MKPNKSDWIIIIAVLAIGWFIGYIHGHHISPPQNDRVEFDKKIQKITRRDDSLRAVNNFFWQAKFDSAFSVVNIRVNNIEKNHNKANNEIKQINRFTNVTRNAYLDSLWSATGLK